LMVYQETLAAWQWKPSPEMPGRFDAAVAEMIRRDRNHPSVTIWGLLNEMQDPEIFQHAVGMLPLVRSLDPTRLVLLNSGRFEAANLMDEGERSEIGACALPHQSSWSPGFADYHRYVPRPLESEPIHRFRTLG